MSIAADLLSFPSDRPIRARYFTTASYAHPAKMHARLLLWLVERYSRPGLVEFRVITPLAQ